MATLSGETTVASDMILFDGQAIGKRGPTTRRKIGLLSAPGERLGHAAPAMSLRENTVITAAERKSLLNNGFIDWTAADQYTQDIIAGFDVRTPDTYTCWIIIWRQFAEIRGWTQFCKILKYLL